MELNTNSHNSSTYSVSQNAQHSTNTNKPAINSGSTNPNSYKPLKIKLSDFLSAFFPTEDEPIQLRAFKAKNAPDNVENHAQKLTITRKTLQEEWTKKTLIDFNQKRGIYFVVNSGGNTDKEITRFNACFVEADNSSIYQQHDALDNCPIPPSIRVETKKSVHAYYLLDESCTVEQWREIQYRLIAYFDGDASIKNPSRVMRLPYFNHLEIEADGILQKKRVECVFFAPERRYTVEQMLEAFPPVKKQELKTVSAASPTNQKISGNGKRYSKYVQAVIAAERQKVSSAAYGTRNNTLNSAAYNLASLILSGEVTETEIEQILLSAASSCGLPSDEAQSAIRSGMNAGKLAPRQIPANAETVAEIGEDDWAEPEDLPDGLCPVPTLPESIIPAPLRDNLVDISERLQVPLDFVAIPAFVAISSVIGNQIQIRPKRHDNWSVTPNLWGAIVGRPGVMKSPAIAETLKPIYRLVKEAEEEYSNAKSHWQFEKEAAEMRKAVLRDAMKKAAKDGNSLEEFRAKLLTEMDIEEPHERRYVVNDTTVEKYGELLNQNPNGLLIFRDELTGWLRSLDKEQNASDRAFYLESWNGDSSFVYDRIGRGTLKIEKTTTSILGGIQPSRLESYLRQAINFGEGDDGLIQRLQLLVYPDIKKTWENIDRYPDKNAKNKAYEIYKWLSQIDHVKIGAEKDDNEQAFLRFSNEAQEFFDEYFTDLNTALRNGEFEHPALESHFSKYKSLMPSLALIFHLCDVAEKYIAAENDLDFVRILEINQIRNEQIGAVSLQAAEKAAAFCEYLMEHAKRVYGMGIGAAVLQAKSLATHIRKGDLLETFTARDVWLKGWSGLSDHKSVIAPLELLESLHWLRSVEVRPGIQGGRPTIRYIVNSKIRGERS